MTQRHLLLEVGVEGPGSEACFPILDDRAAPEGVSVGIENREVVAFIDRVETGISLNLFLLEGPDNAFESGLEPVDQNAFKCGIIGLHVHAGLQLFEKFLGWHLACARFRSSSEKFT